MGNKVDISAGIIKVAQNDIYFGRMNDASGAAFLRGLCGDEMEFYLVIQDNKVKEIKYYTDGCIFTKACAGIVCRLAFQKSIDEALRISPRQIIEELKHLPQEYIHCSILAVSTLHKAIADYLLKP
jgi:nitrogen fixation NifU-like protein